MQVEFNPFRVPLKSSNLSSVLEKVLGLGPLIRGYDARPTHQGENINGAPFLEHTLNVLDVDIDVENEEYLTDIPKEGPVIFVANHPYGGLDGVAMTQLLLKHRPDLKVMTNKMLTRIPELSDLFIGVDVLSENAAKENAKGIRLICKHLSQGGALLIYPAGTVSAINTKSWQIEDSEWHPLVGRLAQRYKASCMPFYIGGRNSKLFYAMGLIHKRLRTLMLPRELSNKSGHRIQIHAGPIITPDELKHAETDEAATHYLKMSSQLIGRNLDQSDVPQAPAVDSQTITKQHSQENLLQDLAGLEEYRLLSKNGFSVYCAPYDRLGSVMQEIAHAREVTFRAAGEGTGLTSDSDQFDPHYLHLFLWDDKEQRLVGGYRIGQSDKIIKTLGIKALYSRSLYHYDESFIQQLGSALEMGRSFVTPEYQRHPRALDLLWQGIGNYVAQNPQYHTLFGCVSISQEHSELARAFLSDSMMEGFRAKQEYLNKVRPVVPLKVKGKVWTTEALASLSNIAVINKLLGRCDPGKSIPILLRHYLALNGRFVCFTVNEGFNNSLDGLILVDLRETPKKYIKRYLGKTGSEQFLQQWNAHESTD